MLESLNARVFVTSCRGAVQILGAQIRHVEGSFRLGVRPPLDLSPESSAKAQEDFSACGDQPIDEDRDRTDQQHGTHHCHCGADRSLVWLSREHMNEEAARLSQDADKERRARCMLDHRG